MKTLTEDVIEALVEAAAEVRSRAHAPYSGFAVGAAILDASGRISVGCNVENASYGLSVCAERHAVAAAVAAGATGLRGLAVVTDTVPPASPCGACRQVLAEFGDFQVVLANLRGDRQVTTVGELLPLAFGPDFLADGRI
jgi:cytidine deaminase